MPPTTLAANHEEQGGLANSPHPGIVLLAAALVAFNFLAFILVQRNNSNFEKGDFKMFYSAVMALRTGHAADLYSREFYVSFQRQLLPSLPPQDVKVYTHPPYELLIFWPLSFLSYKAACYCWLAITLLLAVVCGRMLRSYLAVLALFPLLATLLQQQDSVLALLILIGAWLAFRRDRDEWAGFLLGLALFKFQLVLPLALVLLFWKPKMLKGFAPSAILVFLLSLVMVGPPGLRSYAGYLSGMAHDSESAVSRFYKVDPRTDPDAARAGLRTGRSRQGVYVVHGNGSDPPMDSRVAGSGLSRVRLEAHAWGSAGRNKVRFRHSGRTAGELPFADARPDPAGAAFRLATWATGEVAARSVLRGTADLPFLSALAGLVGAVTDCQFGADPIR